MCVESECKLGLFLVNMLLSNTFLASANGISQKFVLTGFFLFKGSAITNFKFLRELV